MSQFDQLMMYLLVAETKSFTAAAEKLQISANAVNKQVTQLEQQLNLTLLSRSTRRLILTEIGKVIYEEGKIIQQKMEDIKKYAQSLQMEPSGTLSIVSTVGMGQDLLTPYLSEFLQLHQKIQLNLQFSDQFPDFSSRSENPVDIAYGFPTSLMPKTLNDLELVRRRVYAVERIVCASPAYLKKYGEPQTYQDLQNHCYIAHTQNSKNPLLRECEQRHIKFSRFLQVNNTASILKMALNGDGIASTPDFVARAALQAGTLKRILGIHQENKTDTYLFYKKTRYLPVKLKAFIEFFSEKYS